MNIVAKVLNNKKESQAELPLSVSKAKTFSDCKAKYKFCYIEKLPQKEFDFHIFGKFAHDILENFHKELIANSDLEDRPLMTKCFKAALEKYGPKLKEEQKLEVRDIMKVYLEKREQEKNEKTQANVIACEQEFYIDIGYSVLLNGFIDLIQIDVDGVLHVADYKTTKDKKYLKDFFQLLTYAYVLMLKDPDLQIIRTSFIPLRHQFKYITKEFKREEVMDQVQDKFLNYAKEINEERIFRPSESFLCKFCSYLDICQDGKQFLIKRGWLKEEGFGLTSW